MAAGSCFCQTAKQQVHAILPQVIVVEDENGNIVRETMKDTDTLARYKTMHETLVYLAHLDHDDTETQMLEKLRLQVQLLQHALEGMNRAGAFLFEHCTRPHALWPTQAADCRKTAVYVQRNMQMLQMNGKDFSWGSLNTLCWAVGSISGSMAEEQENRCALWQESCFCIATRPT
jgi:exportin-1